MAGAELIFLTCIYIFEDNPTDHKQNWMTK